MRIRAMWMQRTDAKQLESVRIDAKLVRTQISTETIRIPCEIDPKRCGSMRIDEIDVKRMQVDGLAKLHGRKTVIWLISGCIINETICCAGFSQWPEHYCRPHLKGSLVRELSDYQGSQTAVLIGVLRISR